MVGNQIKTFRGNKYIERAGEFNMKKWILISFLSLSTLTLVACGSNQMKQVTQQSSSSSKQELKKNRQEAFQTVLDRYKSYQQAINSGDDSRLSEALKQVEATSEEYMLIDNLGHSGTSVDFQYAFVDLDKDGQDELLIGKQDYISAIYYLKNSQPTLLHVAYAASVGGARSSLTAYENGQVVFAAWQSSNPEVNLTLYKVEASVPNKQKETTIQMNDKKKIEEELGVSSTALNLKNLKWEAIDKGSTTSSKESDMKSSSQSEDIKSETGFQVRVQISDLEIRKEPSAKSQSLGKISQGIHTISETTSAEGYTWGKLQSGQGWIALDYTERIEGEKQTQSESSGMNIQEIQTGNFSSVKGSWRNAQGNSITFDANGLTQVNGNPAGDVVFDKFAVQGEKLTAVTKTSEGISETPIVFTPSGQDGRESIFWSKNHVSDGTDIYYRE